MHSKFLKHGKGSCKSAADYLLGKKSGDNHDLIATLKGDPYQVAAIADELDFSNKYKSFVVSFHENDKPTPKEIESVIQEYENHLFAGLKPDQFATAWVQHTDQKTGKIDLHMITPAVELTTGKSLNIAPPHTLKYVDSVRDYLNEKHGWKSPDILLNPENARDANPHTLPIWATESNKKMQAAVIENCREVVADGSINNRQEMLTYLNDLGFENGFEVVGAKRGSISIRLENSKQNIRLAGSMFAQDFKPDLDAKMEEPKPTEAELQSKMEGYRENRETYNAERYPDQSSELMNIAKVQQQLEILHIQKPKIEVENIAQVEAKHARFRGVSSRNLNGTKKTDEQKFGEAFAAWIKAIFSSPYEYIPKPKWNEAAAIKELHKTLVNNNYLLVHQHIEMIIAAGRDMQRTPKFEDQALWQKITKQPQIKTEAWVEKDAAWEAIKEEANQSMKRLGLPSIDEAYKQYKKINESIDSPKNRVKKEEAAERANDRKKRAEAEANRLLELEKNIMTPEEVQKELELQQKAQKIEEAQARQDAQDGIQDIAPTMG